MFRAVTGHVRRQPVAFVALFFALGGGAIASTNYITSGDKIAKGDLAGSTYGDPLIGASKVTNRKLQHPSLTVATDRTLIGGGLIGLGGRNRKPLAVANGGIGTGQLANGAITSAKFAPGAQAPDSAQLGGLSATAYGAVMSGRINGLCTYNSCGDGGAPSGISTASGTESNVETLSPDLALKARDFSIQLTTAPGSGSTRTFYLFTNGFGQPICEIADASTTCTGSAVVDVPANSRLLISEEGAGAPAAAAALFAFRLTPS